MLFLYAIEYINTFFLEKLDKMKDDFGKSEKNKKSIELYTIVWYNNCN